MIERLAVDESLRRILGWERRSQVPSEATFSGAFAVFAQGDLPDKMHAALIERSLGGRIVGVIARDATEIEAREKPAAKEANNERSDPPSDGAQPPRKRGRPRKDEQRPKPEPTRLERQTSQNVDQMFRRTAQHRLRCRLQEKRQRATRKPGSATSSKIDVACGQITVSCVLTSASVHDSQVAIPLMTMTGAPVSYLYDLMDAAYDAAAIHDRARTLGHAPIIDRNFRAQHEVKAEIGTGSRRMKFIHMPDANDVIYDFRTMVEHVDARTEGRIRDRFLRVRGSIKVKCPPDVRHRRARRPIEILRVASFRPAPALTTGARDPKPPEIPRPQGIIRRAPWK